MKSYVTATLRVSKANMQQTHYIVSPAPIFAAVMAAHAFGMNLPTHVHVERVGIVLHDARPWIEVMETKEGHNNLEVVQRRGGSIIGDENETQQFRKYSGALPVIPSALCDYTLSLIMECDDTVDLDCLNRIIGTSRLAGGVIERVKLHESETLNEAISKVRSGFWAEDATDLLAQKMDELRDPMRALLLAPQGQPWVMPATLGYCALEPFGKRLGARMDPRREHGDMLDHAFAEAMVGLVRYRSMNHIRQQIAAVDNAVEPQMWFSAWHDDEFVVQTTRQTWIKPVEEMPAPTSDSQLDHQPV